MPLEGRGLGQACGISPAGVAWSVGGVWPGVEMTKAQEVLNGAEW